MDNNEKMSIGKSAVITLIVIAVIAVIIVALTFLKIPTWIPLLGLTVWSTIGMPMDIKSVCKVWLSGGVALLLGYLLGHAETLGLPALIIAGAGVVLMIFGIVSGRMSYVFNMVTALFMTTGTAAGIVLEAVPVIKGLAFGFVVFGLLPSLLVTSMAKKKSADQ